MTELRDRPAKNEAIEIRVERIAQLFDTLDPSPFRQKALDRSAEEYIVGWARELPRDQPLDVLVHLPAKEVNADHSAEIASALENFFQYRAQIVSGDLHELFRVGRRSLTIGVIVLVFCLLSAEIVASTARVPALGWILQQSLLILGWVANWRPLEIFLYDWWPLARRRDLYLRLAAARVGLVGY